jgi:2'-5' RNA ligase
LDNVPEDYVYVDPEDNSFGRQPSPGSSIHITVKFGFYIKEPNELIEALRNASLKEPLVYRLTNTSLFDTAPQYDVLKIDIDSPSLHELHEIFNSIKNDDTHPDYHPHCTISYLKKGFGKYLTGQSQLATNDIPFNHLVFSNQENVNTVIPL